MLVAGVQAGDDVIVPSLSFIATANVVTYLGARPVFADVDVLTGNVSAETLDAVLTPQTTAVSPTELAASAIRETAATIRV